MDVQAKRGLPRLSQSPEAAAAAYYLDTTVKLRTYIVEDNATIRENLIATLEELAEIESVGIAETEFEGTDWLTRHSAQWDVAILDLFLCWPPAATALRTRRSWCSATTRRPMCARAVHSWASTQCSTNPTRSTHWSTIVSS
jgi:hypothetical protein